jgi:hypothetical protein
MTPSKKLPAVPEALSPHLGHLEPARDLLVCLWIRDEIVHLFQVRKDRDVLEDARVVRARPRHFLRSLLSDRECEPIRHPALCMHTTTCGFEAEVGEEYGLSLRRNIDETTI